MNPGTCELAERAGGLGGPGAPWANTVISTVPAPVPAGEVAVICVSETTVMPVAEVLPNFTLVVPVKPAPVIVTLVPPVVTPRFGLTALITGAALGVIELEAAEGLLVPTAFVAVAVKG